MPQGFLSHRSASPRRTPPAAQSWGLSTGVSQAQAGHGDEEVVTQFLPGAHTSGALGLHWGLLNTWLTASWETHFGVSRGSADVSSGLCCAAGWGRGEHWRVSGGGGG